MKRAVSLIRSAMIVFPILCAGCGDGDGDGKINQEATPPAAVTFSSATPSVLIVQGAGNAASPRESTFTFIVKDANDAPLPGQSVEFTLSETTGGIALSPTAAVSDRDGNVRTTVRTGTASASIVVRAKAAGTAISGSSTPLTITFPSPTQNGMTVTVSPRNVEAYSFDGVEARITVRLLDNYGNPVQDGTAVSFQCTAGEIRPYGLTTGGVATGVWRSRGLRPANGRVQILAYTVGEESFTDLNGNGLADSGEFTDIPEAFLSSTGIIDGNGEFVYTPGRDFFLDFNGNGVYDRGDGAYNGILQGPAYQGALTSVYVFRNVQLVMSGSNAVIFIDRAQISGPGDIRVIVSDQNNNPMPAGSTVTVTTTNGFLTGQTEFVVPDSLAVGGNTFTVHLESDGTPSPSGELKVCVKPPLEWITTCKTFSITGGV